MNPWKWLKSKWFLALGRIYNIGGKSDKEVLELLDKVLSMDPSNLKALIGIAEISAQRGDTRTARAKIEKVLSLDPQYAYAYVNLGRICEIEGKKQDAIAAYEKAIDFDSKSHRAFCDIGCLYTDLGEYGKAEQCLLEAIRLKPTALYHHNIGILYLKMANEREAIEHFRSALRIDPSYRPSQVVLWDLTYGRF